MCDRSLHLQHYVLANMHSEYASHDWMYVLERGADKHHITHQTHPLCARGRLGSFLYSVACVSPSPKPSSAASVPKPKRLLGGAG